ncbi:CRISPR system precrRNA processing endoribonuclease RAMP protein Cas6 [Chloroflexia bacterium SDU3-3]|nr:CRISPR system precrRNA processing endoribonuclease RAMP protein Cas6 [Chloroflexia bacterium SDU3-3]
MTLTTYHLEFRAVARTPLELDDQAGSQLRGALVGALWQRFCANHQARTCAECPLAAACPVAALIAPMRAEGEPGGDQRPRPYVTRPPQGGRYRPGDPLAFGLALFGPAAQLFPYVVMAAQGVEQSGLGRPLAANGGRRGLIQIDEIAAVSPLDGARQPLLAKGAGMVASPGLAVAAADVAAFAATLPAHALTLQFLTPLRLIDGKQLVKRIALRPLVQRLMRRLDDLSIAYGAGPLGLDFRALLDVAERAVVIEDRTRWVDVASYSARQGGRTPIGGLVGQATFAGDLAPLRELLVWGSLVHIGKNAVKGDGCYRILADQRALAAAH